MTDAILQAHGEYEAARRILIDLAPCTKCCPPDRRCGAGYYILGCDIKRCGRCGGDGFLINWDEEEDE